MPEYLTPDEVADKVRVSRRTVYKWLTAEELPALRAGRGWRIEPAALDAFMRRRKGKRAMPPQSDSKTAA